MIQPPTSYPNHCMLEFHKCYLPFLKTSKQQTSKRFQDRPIYGFAESLSFNLEFGVQVLFSNVESTIYHCLVYGIFVDCLLIAPIFACAFYRNFSYSSIRCLASSTNGFLEFCICSLVATGSTVDIPQDVPRHRVPGQGTQHCVALLLSFLALLDSLWNVD